MSTAPAPPRPDPAALLAWYDRHRRDLPGALRPAGAADPYRVWLSEIMLQQTTVATVGPYFDRFLARFPDIRALAAAPLDDVCMLAGARLLRPRPQPARCAQLSSRRMAAAFPTTRRCCALPGIGDYTAAAIAAIAFDRPAAAVDGNVERVVARLFAERTPLPRGKAALRVCRAAGAECGPAISRRR